MSTNKSHNNNNNGVMLTKSDQNSVKSAKSDNKYRKIEALLYNYPKLKVEIQNLKIDIEEMQDVIGIRGQSDNPAPGSITYAFTSSVESEAESRIEKLPDKIAALERVIRSKERQLKKLDNLLSILTEEEYKLVELRYFKQYKLNRVSEILDVSLDTVVRKRRETIRKLISF